MARKTRKVSNAEDADQSSIADAAGNLIVADIALRTGSYLLRTLAERNILGRRFGKVDARQIIANRTVKHTVASVIVSKIATRSVPGAIMVGTGLVAKTLFDQSQKRRKAKRLARKGD